MGDAEHSGARTRKRCAMSAGFIDSDEDGEDGEDGDIEAGKQAHAGEVERIRGGTTCPRNSTSRKKKRAKKAAPAWKEGDGPAIPETVADNASVRQVVASFVAPGVSEMLLDRSRGNGGLTQIIGGEAWKDMQMALRDTSLLATASKLTQMESMETGLSFMAMINLIHFAIKVDR